MRYEADVVFSGHSHNYQRTVPIRGVRYFVIGGGGASLYDSAFTPGSHEYATTCYHYATAAITNMLLNFQAVRSDGLVFDSTVITNGRLYTVYRAENLSTTFVEQVSGVTGGSYTADVESVDHAFYRVEVELP